MNFYTNISQWGNTLLIREVVNGQRLTRRVKYKPTMYAPVAEPTEWKTLDGKYVTPVEFHNMKEAKEWVEFSCDDCGCMVSVADNKLKNLSEDQTGLGQFWQDSLPRNFSWGA
mgnify:CR=1 FL=1